jgi:hypothetical protein
VRSAQVFLSDGRIQGTRPEFEVVTGVSTGALIAPLAFLGRSYDTSLRQFYTTTSTGDIFISRGLLGGIFNDALSTPRRCGT